MELDDVLRNPLFGEEALNLDSLVTLELDDLAHLVVVDERPVAREFLV
jgi:TFIIF-interacting CTD phosphatase-like protein